MFVCLGYLGFVLIGSAILAIVVVRIISPPPSFTDIFTLSKNDLIRKATKNNKILVVIALLGWAGLMLLLCSYILIRVS